METINEKQTGKSQKVVSFSETLTYDILISSHVVGSTLSLTQTMVPRTRSKTKSKALMQQENQKEKMMAQGQGLGEDLNFLDT